jgi:uncharacterized membrane protein
MSGNHSGTQRWRRIALPASLILNLFLVALIGGHLLRREFAERSRETSLAAVLTNVEHLLPPADAAAFGAIIRRDAPRHAEATEQLTEARSELERQITNEPFDKDATQQALTTWRQSVCRFVDEFSNTLVDALSQVSPESRRKLVAERHKGKP